LLVVRVKKSEIDSILPIASIYIESMNSYLINPNCQANGMSVISSPEVGSRK